MKSVRALLEQYLPEEKILKESQRRVNITWKTQISIGYDFSLKPTVIIETENLYILDRRVNTKYQNIVSSLLAPFIFGAFGYFVVGIKSLDSLPLWFLISFVAMLIAVFAWNMVYSGSLASVVYFEKAWVESKEDTESKSVLKGTVPSGVRPLLGWYLDEKASGSLSFVDKLMSDIFLKKASMVPAIPRKFVISISG